MTRWTDRLDAIASGTVKRTPMAETLDLPRIKGWEPGHVWLEWSVNPKMFTIAGTVFGGYLAALADQALGFAALTVLAEDENIVTSDLRVSFLRPVNEGTLRIDAKVVHRSRNMVHVDVTFARENNGKLIARASATQVVVHDAPGSPSKNQEPPG